MLSEVTVYFPIVNGQFPFELLQPTVFVVHPAVPVEPCRMQQRGVTDMATWPGAVHVGFDLATGQDWQSPPVVQKPYVILARTSGDARRWAEQWGIPATNWVYRGYAQQCEGMSNVKVLIAPGFDKRDDAKEIREIIDFGVKCAGVEIVEPTNWKEP